MENRLSNIIKCCQCGSELFIINNFNTLKNLLRTDSMICPYCKASNVEHIRKILNIKEN